MSATRLRSSTTLNMVTNDEADHYPLEDVMYRSSNSSNVIRPSSLLDLRFLRGKHGVVELRDVALQLLPDEVRHGHVASI